MCELITIFVALLFEESSKVYKCIFKIRNDISVHYFHSILQKFVHISPYDFDLTWGKMDRIQKMIGNVSYPKTI